MLEIVRKENPIGVIVQLGGQTPLKLTRALEAAGVKILGTSPDAIDIAEDRRRFEKLARELGILQPENGTATSLDEAVTIADALGIRCWCVRRTCWVDARWKLCTMSIHLRGYFERAVRVSEERPGAG